MPACYRPQGAIMSYTGEPIVYYSYETRPVSIEIVDLRNDEVVFQMDVPPGKQLVLDFRPDKGDDPVYTPDLMRYQVWDIGKTTGRLRNAMTVPSATSRRIDVEYRAGAEYKGETEPRRLRADEMIDRPDWWTPEGGELPEDRQGIRNYDGR